MVQVDVYGDTRATCVQRVLILLEELDLKYNVIKVYTQLFYVLF